MCDWLQARSNRLSQLYVSGASLKVQPPDDCSQSVSSGVCVGGWAWGGVGWRERGRLLCSWIWHSVENLHFICHQQWGFRAQWRHILTTKAQKILPFTSLSNKHSRSQWYITAYERCEAGRVCRISGSTAANMCTGWSSPSLWADKGLAYKGGLIGQ